jgi:hypothetical protein
MIPSSGTEIYQQPQDAPDFALAAEVGSNTTHVSLPATPGEPHFFRVRTVSGVRLLGYRETTAMTSGSLASLKQAVELSTR